MSDALRRIAPYAAFLIISYAASAVGAFTPPGDWYETLAKPAWTPPDWAFPVVWTALYAMIGVAGALIWKRLTHTTAATAAMAAWSVQIVLNGLWSWLFFGAHLIGVALAEIVLLWLAIAATVILARDVSRAAAGLMVPYLVWVSFAVALNAAIFVLN